jgi:DNA-directed RNA polymerase specialized sigma24 family protein
MVVACSAWIRMGRHPDSAFLALVDAHEEMLLRAARLLTGDWDRAEDLLQDTLAWALAAWDTLSREPATPLRLRQRLVAAYLDGGDSAGEDDEEPGFGEPGLGGDSPVPPAHRQLVDSLAELNPEHRAILVSRYYLGLSAAEIGEVLGVEAEDVAAVAEQALASLRWVR